MTTPGTKSRPPLPRPLVVSGIAVAAVAVLAGYYHGSWWRPRGPVAAVALVSAASPAAPRAAKPPAPPDAPVAAAISSTSAVAAPPVLTSPPPIAAAEPPGAPTFDVVRVSPDGSAVIAGRATPGAEVTVFDGSTAVAEARADRRGEFVMLPSAPLKAGGRRLTLASRAGSTPVVHGAASVVVVVPNAVANDRREPVVAVLLPPAAPPRILQHGRVPGTLALDVVDYDNAGSIRFTGEAKPGAPVRFYVDDASVGDARANGAGQWTLSPGAVVTPGLHRLRADELDASGHVVARVELPFERAAAAVAVMDGRVVVQPGQNLWRIARAVYGRGIRYTVIYLANRSQIRSPRMIYPGQTFAVPSDKPGGG